MILFRADGNPTLGIGHIMRCLSIADALKDNGTEVAFACADDNVIKIITERGPKSFVLGTDYRKMEEELDSLSASQYYREAQGIIVDSYYVTDKYFKALSQDKKIVYIDDYYSKYPVAGIINYSTFAEEAGYLKVYGKKLPKLFLGSKYAPLRKEFSDCKAIEIKKTVTDVLVLTGGADSFNVARDFATLLYNRNDDKVTYHFVVGAMSQCFEALKEIESKCSFIKIHYNVKDMKSLMQSCDIAISAAGSTLYELCACGVPTINYILADNQLLNSDSFTKKGIMIYAGDVRKTECFFEKLLSLVKELSLDYEKRVRMSELAHEHVDGKGAARLATELKELLK